MRKVLITGITGFVGSHLLDYYLDNTDYQIYGLKRTRSPLNNIVDHLNNPRIHFLIGDITDFSSICDVVKSQQFDVVHHLAAQAFVPDSWSMFDKTIDVNIKGTLNLLMAIVQHYSRDNYPKIHLAGSSEEYGLVYPNETPITELNPLRPLSPYGVSKIATENLGYQMHCSYGLPIVVTRAFNHEGPRRGKQYVISNFAAQLVKQRNEPDLFLEVGNTNAIRDFTDVRDIVRGYYLAVKLLVDDKIDYDVYNLSSQDGRTIKQVINLFSAVLGKPIALLPDESRMRPSDVEILIGGFRKFNLVTGWAPTISFDKTLRDTYNYWVNILDQRAVDQ